MELPWCKLKYTTNIGIVVVHAYMYQNFYLFCVLFDICSTILDARNGATIVCTMNQPKVKIYFQIRD